MPKRQGGVRFTPRAQPTSDDRPRVWVQVQVVYPAALGGALVTKTVELPVDEPIPGFGSGVEAMIDAVAAQAREAVWRIAHPGGD